MDRAPRRSALTRFREIWAARRTLWLLVRRDLKVRYADSALGYLWSVLEPLLMSMVYWFVFTKIFNRTVGQEPYIIFLLAGLLPWLWFTTSVGDSTKALRSQARLVRSTAVPREVWALRSVLAKAIEFTFSLPVLAVFMIFYPPDFNRDLWLYPVAVLLQFTLMTGLTLLLAPAAVLLRDLEPLVKIALRFMFYASPVIYGIEDIATIDVPDIVRTLYIFNPMSGILSTYRAGFFDVDVPWLALGASAVISVFVLLLGSFVFARLENRMLKEM